MLQINLRYDDMNSTHSFRKDINILLLKSRVKMLFCSPDAATEMFLTVS
jgi:hypothetical protein